MGQIQSLNGKLATAANIEIITRLGPEYIRASRCIFTEEQLTSLLTFFNALQNFIVNTTPSSLINKVGGIENLFILTRIAILSDEGIDAAFAEVFAGVEGVNPIYSEQPLSVRRGFNAFVILVVLLSTATDDPTAFSSFLTRQLFSKNILRRYLIDNLGKSVSKLNIFVNTLEKIFFANNTNLTLGQNNLVIVTSPTVLTSGVLRQVFPSDCQDDGNLGECIAPLGAGLQINCGCYVNTSCNQTVLKSPANVDNTINAVLNILGEPRLFRSSTIRQGILLKKKYAKQDAYDVYIDDSSSSSSCSSNSICGSDSEVSIGSDIERDNPLMAGSLATYAVSSGACSQNNRRVGFAYNKGPTKKGKGKKTKGKKENKGCNTCAAPGFSAGLQMGNNFNSSSSSSGNSNVCSSSSSSYLTKVTYPTRVYNGSILQYLQSIQGGIRFLSMKVNELLIKRDAVLSDDSSVSDELSEVACPPPLRNNYDVGNINVNVVQRGEFL